MNTLKKEDFNHSSTQNGGTYTHKSEEIIFDWEINRSCDVHILTTDGSHIIPESNHQLQLCDEESRANVAEEIALEAFMSNPELYKSSILVD